MDSHQGNGSALFLLEVLILVGGCYLVRNGKELERYLCNEKLGEDKTLILNHSVNYDVSHNGFCIVNATGSIIIMSDSSQQLLVLIKIILLHIVLLGLPLLT